MITKEINLYDVVKVIEDLPKISIKKCMVATIVYVYKTGRIFEAEFITDDGSTFCIETLEAYSIEKITGKIDNNFPKIYISFG